ncbi:hypothetical protein ACSAZK_01345 [Methanosarcina sp. Mfa9]
MDINKCYKIMLGALTGVALIYVLAYVFGGDSESDWGRIEVE